MKKIIAFVLLGILLTGCKPLQEAAEQAPAMLGFSTPEPAEAVDSDVLNVALGGTAEFQPHSVHDISARHVLDLVYEPLFQMNSEAEPVPVLAERLVNRGTEIDIYIKSGIKWHDGSDFTASDVLYTLNLVIGGYSVYSNDIMVSAWAKGSDCVTVCLSRCAALPECIFTFPIVKNNSPQNMEFPVGTGPFKYMGKEGYDTYIFEPFSREKQSFSKLRVINLRDAEREKELFQSGETDILYINNEHLMSYTPRANTKVYEYPTNHMVYIGFNALRVPQEIRKGIYYATDRVSLTKKVFGQSAQVAVIPFVTGKSQTYTNDYNLASAEDVLEKAGYVMQDGYYQKDGVPLKLGVIVQPGGKHTEVADELVQRLDNLGIECEVKDPEYYYADLQEGDYDIAVGTWENTGDLWSMLQPGNMFFYESEDIMRVYSQLHDRGDLNNVLINHVPFIPVAFKYDAVAVSSKIKSDLNLSYTAPFKGLSDILN